MTDRLKHMKEILMCAVENQLTHLEDVDAQELGEVVDMIKDLEEAEYYCAVVKAMEESEENEKHLNSNMMYYTPMRHDGGGHHDPYYMENDMSRRYYGDGSNTSSGNGNNSYYTEREFPMAFQDGREGRSPRSRRMYMEAKETHQDKATQMRELEKYMQELVQDITEMIEGASSEERQYLSKKISALATKINTNP